MHFPRNLRGVVISFLEVIAIKDSSKTLLLWMFGRLLNIPTGSMYGTFTPHLVDFKVNLNVGKYAIHGSYGSVWLTWKPRMIEYCWIQSMLHESSHQNRVWVGEVIHGEVLKFFSMTFTGLTDVFTWRRWNRCFVLFVQQFSSKRVINFESWCFAVLPSLYEKMKCSSNLGEGSKSVVPELVALKFMILWKHPTCWKYFPDYAQCTHRDTPETLWWHWFWLNPRFCCRAEVPQITEHSQVPATCPKDI